VLVADPILEFTIPEINPGEGASLYYFVDNDVGDEEMQEYQSAIISDFTEQENLCIGVSCDDSNPCTTDYCRPLTGECINRPINDGVACGEGMHCSTGQCVLSGAPSEPPAEVPGEPVPIGTLVIVIVVLAVLVAVFYYSQKKGGA